MNKEEVIDFLIKCGMWVKDGAIKKADIPRAMALINEQKTRASVTTAYKWEAGEDIDSENGYNEHETKFGTNDWHGQVDDAGSQGGEWFVSVSGPDFHYYSGDENLKYKTFQEAVRVAEEIFNKNH